MKYFRIAQEGQTTDGRVIERKWLHEIAETYDPKKYGARINLEHIRGLLPDSPFKAYGDVVAVKVVDNAEGKAELFAQLDPTPELIAMVKARQKVYTSMEIDTNFGDTGKCGLVGLAVTDSPASMGTEYLAFCAGMKDQTANPLASKKQKPNNLFSTGLPVVMEFSAEPVATAPDEVTTKFMGMLSKAFGVFSGQAAPTATVAPPSPPAALPPGLAGFSTDLRTALETFATEKDAQLKTVRDEFAAFQKTAVTREEFDALRNQLDTTDRNHTQRPPATGGSGAIQTDC